MAHALNNVGDRKNFDNVLEESKLYYDEDTTNRLKKHLQSIKTGLD
jgi:hypothetical protein